jgi:hypothetical protein
MLAVADRELAAAGRGASSQGEDRQKGKDR